MVRTGMAVSNASYCQDYDQVTCGWARF